MIAAALMLISAALALLAAAVALGGQRGGRGKAASKRKMSDPLARADDTPNLSCAPKPTTCPDGGCSCRTCEQFEALCDRPAIVTGADGKPYCISCAPPTYATSDGVYHGTCHCACGPCWDAKEQDEQRDRNSFGAARAADWVYRNENMKRLDERRKRLGVSDQSWQRERSTDGGGEPTARDDAAHMCDADGDAMTCVHEVLSISRRCVEVAAAWMLATYATGVMVFWMLWILSQANPATAQPVTLAMPDASPLAWVAEMQLSPPEVRRPDSVERAWIGLEQAVGSTLAPSGLHAKLGPDYAVAVALVGEEPRAFARSCALCLMVAWPVCDARLSVEPYSRGLPPVRLPYLSQAPLAQVSSQLQPLARWHVPPRPARLLQPSPGPSLTTVFALASPPGHHLSMVALLAALGPWPAPRLPPAVAARPGRCAAFAPGCGF